jgi:hypothetical protein
MTEVWEFEGVVSLGMSREGTRSIVYVLQLKGTL